MKSVSEGTRAGFLARMIRQFSKFVVVGLINTGIDFAILNALTILTGITQGVSMLLLNTISFTAATTNSYFLNKHWTFRDTGKEEEEKKFFQFIAVSLIGAIINGGIVFAVTTYTKPAFGALGLGDQLWVNIAKVLATGISLVWNFLGYKFIVFKK